jgi:protein-S-isoprenylcysteine O-methyltransferase Ste14
MSGYWFPKPYADRVARWRVPVGFALVGSFGWFSRPSYESLVIGIPISVIGILIRAWAAGHLAKNQELATGGPYAFTRNPLYIGTLLVAAGLVVASRSPGLAVLFTAVFLGIYLPVIELEEQHLRKIFPGYAAYAERVPRLWPRVPITLGRQAFSLALYRRNQEYQAAAGFIAGLIFLYWKAWRGI